jgi:hypothetical protein
MPRPYEVEIEKNAKTDRRARATMEPQKQSEEKQEPAPSPNKKAVQPPQAETERGEIAMCNTWALSIHSSWYLLCVSLLYLFICPSVLLFNRWSFVLAMIISRCHWYIPRYCSRFAVHATERGGSASMMCKAGGQCLRASVDSSQCSHLTDS